MAPNNTRTAAVVDPILSTHARGYRNSEFISHILFPRVPVPSRSARVIKFGKEAFRMMNTRRAPGSDKKRVQYGYASDPVSLNQEALEGTLPMEVREEADRVPGVDLAEGAINMVMDVVDLGLEYEAAQLARNPANYAAGNRLALVGAARWTSSTSAPSTDIDTAKEVIRSMIGRYPNTLVLGPKAMGGLRRNEKIMDRFKYTSSDSITAKMLAAYFDVERVEVGKAVFLPETVGDNVGATDIWGDDAILAYVPQQGENYQAPSYGYTYELAGYPQVEQPYYERRNSSWIYPYTAERRPYLVGAEAGFLFQGAGGAPA